MENGLVLRQYGRWLHEKISSRNNAIKKFIIFLTLILFIAACDDGNAQTQQKCSEDVYVRMGDYILKLPKNRVFGLFYKNKLIEQPCHSSLEEPTISDRFSFKHEIKVPGYDKAYQAQFLFSDTAKKRDYLQEIKATLKEKGETIEDLPKKGTFYRFPLNDTYQTAYYISTSEKLKDVNDNPIVVTNCGPEIKPEFNFAFCSVAFEWHSNIRVWVRTNRAFGDKFPPIESVDTWNEIYPVYLDILKDSLISSPEGDVK